MDSMVFDFKSAKLTKRKLDPKLTERATAQAINDTAKAVNKGNALEMKKDYNSPPKRIKQNIRITKATSSRPVATITFRGRPPGLQHYGARQRVVTGGGVTALGVNRKSGGLSGRRLKRGRGHAVRVEVIKGKRRQIKGGFLQVMPGGGIGVFRRTGEGRSIERLHGPSVAGMFKARDGADRSARIVRLELPSNFNRRYGKLLRRV